MDQQESRVQLVNQKKTSRAVKKFNRYLSNVCYFSNKFHLNCVGNANDDISSEEHFEHSKKSFVQVFYLIFHDPLPLKC